jgi:hypothetical protein
MPKDDAVYDAMRRLREMTPDETRRVNAVLRYGTFIAAARVLGCDPDTVSAAWHRYRQLIADVVIGITSESDDGRAMP